MFHSVYTSFVHLAPFGCFTKLSAKQAKLMQKFVPRSRVGIFRNERNRSTPLESKLMFWCVLYYLDAFGTIWLPYKLDAKRAEVVQKFVPWSRVRIFRNKRTRSTLLDPYSCFGVSRTIWVHLGQFVALQHSVQNGPNLCKSSCHEVASEFFATNAPDPPHWTLSSCFGVFCTIWVHLVPIGYLTKLGAKRAEAVQNFVPWSRVGIFHNKPLDPPHWTLTSCFVALHTIWVHLGQFVALQHLV